VSGFVRSGDFQTDRYFPSGEGSETWRPRFVYHGFQYIEVSGCTSEPRVTALLIHTDVADSGTFSSDNETVNAIQHASRWSTLTNLHGLPTDDPHREKNAWTGDVSLSAEQMLLNFHTTPLLRKWLADVRDSQKPDGALPCVVPSTGWGYNWGNGPDWSSALTHIPWQIYLYTGDKRAIAENYEAITRHFGYVESMAEGGIVNYGIGDWCAPFEGVAISVNMSSFKAPVELTDTGYYYNAADTIARMASVLGLADDEKHYREAAETIKGAFRREFYDTSSNKVAGDCQTSTACMIYQGLHNDSELAPLLDLLLQQIADTGYHQDTGILGNKFLYNVLGDAGRMDIAFKMVLNDTFPSYKHWMDRGATTLWECWNGEGSQNHHMFSDIIASMYKYIGGIRPDETEPGFRHIVMRPSVDCGLRSVNASHESPFGKIVSNWTSDSDSIELNIEVPGGSTATLELPSNIAEGDYPAMLPSGTHHISVTTS
jgi:alpha-L-rhamnosidase